MANRRGGPGPPAPKDGERKSDDATQGARLGTARTSALPVSDSRRQCGLRRPRRGRPRPAPPVRWWPMSVDLSLQRRSSEAECRKPTLTPPPSPARFLKGRDTEELNQCWFANGVR